MPTVDQLPPSGPDRYIVVNDNFDSVSNGFAFGTRVSATAGTTWGYYGGDVNNDGTITTLPNGTVALNVSVTSYVSLNPTTPIVNKNEVGFPPGEVPLAEIVTDGVSITSISDRRQLVSLSRQIDQLQNIAGAANVAIDCLLGRTVAFPPLAAALTLDAPLNPFPGAELLILIPQDGTGGRVVTLNAAFQVGALGSGTANQSIALHVVSDGTNWILTGSAPNWA